jgi:NAD(P)-dependent dehydrogenase (short-subunit alcohol dehydrogenase family)
MTRTVLITGGTGALGSAVTKRFLEQGDRVVVTWVVEPERDRLVKDLSDPEHLTLVHADVTDESSVAKMLDGPEGAGDVDVLVHLVGAWQGGQTVQETTLDTWNKMMDLNLKSALLCSRGVLSGMLARDWGRIILVSSRTARSGRAGQASYAIAKAGVAVLAETIAEETRGTSVTANVLAPSTLDTPANQRAMPEANHADWVPPRHVADAAVFLASEAAGQLRGAWLPVYGSA